MKRDPTLPPSDTPPLGRRARKAIAVRSALFDAGLSALERQPIGLVSVLDITEAADVAKGVFYLHFSGKDAYLIALWEEVQRRFLEGVSAAVAGGRSRSARIEAIVRGYAALASASPASARYWARISSYFPDEVGGPGELTRVRRRYTRELARMISGERPDDVDPSDLRAAIVVDAISRALLVTAMTAEEATCDEETLVRIVAGATRLLERGAATTSGGHAHTSD